MKKKQEKMPKQEEKEMKQKKTTKKMKPEEKKNVMKCPDIALLRLENTTLPVLKRCTERFVHMCEPVANKAREPDVIVDDPQGLTKGMEIQHTLKKADIQTLYDCEAALQK